MDFRGFWKEHAGATAVLMLALLLLVTFFSAPSRGCVEDIFNDHDFVEYSKVLAPITVVFCVHLALIGGSLFIRRIGTRIMACIGGLCLCDSIIYIVSLLWFLNKYQWHEHEFVRLLTQCFLSLLAGIVLSAIYHLFIYYVIEERK